MLGGYLIMLLIVGFRYLKKIQDQIIINSRYLEKNRIKELLILGIWTKKNHNQRTNYSKYLKKN